MAATGPAPWGWAARDAGRAWTASTLSATVAGRCRFAGPAAGQPARTGQRALTTEDVKAIFRNISFTSAEPSGEQVTPKLGRPDNPLPLTDADAMRALAHPARIALLQHLALEGARTATECAPVVGLSPSACSYHLRQLARYGFVAQDQAAAATAGSGPGGPR